MFHLIMPAYIDPGVGSMLFTIIIGLAATAVYFVRTQFIKLKYSFGGKKEEPAESERLPLVIFSDSKRYWNVFKPVCDEMERRGLKAQYWTMSADDPAFSEQYEHITALYIGDGNKAWAKLNMMNADTCLSTTPGLDIYQWKRSKNVRRYVHIFHALDTGITYRMFGLDYYDAVLLTGSFAEKYIREMEEKRSLPAKELVVTGSTYMDALKARIDAHTKEADTGAHTAAHTPDILLAPSWGPSSILSRYGASILDALLKTGYHITVRPHPQSKTSEAELLAGLMAQFPDSEQLSWNYDNDNFEALNRADLMISDYSGVVFDYCLGFDRPLLYADTSFDSAPYDLAWSGYPFWNFETMAKLGRQLKESDFANLKQILDTLMYGESVRAERESVRNEAWQYIGESAVRTVDYLVGKETE